MFTFGWILEPHLEIVPKQLLNAYHNFMASQCHTEVIPTLPKSATLFMEYLRFAFDNVFMEWQRYFTTTNTTNPPTQAFHLTITMLSKHLILIYDYT